MDALIIVTEYSFVIPHDVKTLIKFMGGEKTFESRLDMMVSSFKSQFSRRVVEL